MKKLLFLGVAVIGFALASCNKNEVSPSNASAALSNAAADSMKKGGMPPKLDSVAISSLPSTITTYITTNYTGATIKHAGKDKDGNYVIAILVNNQPKGLLFDAKGAFTKELPPPPQGQNGQQGPPNGGQKPDSIAVSSLPATIKDYITKNYAGAEIKRAGKDKDGNYIVGILLNNQPKGLVFDSTGAFKEEAKLPPPPQGPNGQQGPPNGGQKPDSIAVSSLPTAITDYITKNYAGAEIKRAGKDKDGNYVVGILLNNQPKGLVFDATGAFKEEAKTPPPPKKG